MALNEKKWWSSHVKPAWTSKARGWVANKVQDAFNSGLPDVDVCFRGAAAKIELKYCLAWPTRPETKLTFSKDKVTGQYCVMSPSQLRQLVTWHNCLGLAYVLIGVGKVWFLCLAADFDLEDRNWGITQAELRELALLSGTSYHDLIKVPQYLEELYGHPLEPGE